MDSVPNGGWLDGCLNVLAGVEILRRINAQYNGKPPVTVRLVDWADEEGARFGKSLFGSSACSGNLDMNEARGLVDKQRNKHPQTFKGRWKNDRNLLLTLRGSGRIAFASGSFLAILRLRRRASSTVFGFFWLRWPGRTCRTGRSRPRQVWRGKMGRRWPLRGTLHRRAQAASFYPAHWARSVGEDVFVVGNSESVVKNGKGNRPKRGEGDQLRLTPVFRKAGRPTKSTTATGKPFITSPSPGSPRGIMRARPSPTTQRSIPRGEPLIRPTRTNSFSTEKNLP